MFQYQTEVDARGDLAVAEPVLQLYPNSPNPFVEMTLLWFSIPESASINLMVLDSHGHVVAHKNGYFEAGENHIVLQRSDIREPGIYMYRLETPFGSASRRLVMY
ncbi:MAG: T9SS type A sorting domain-containing protein [Saprospiraceae bacterium]|jgi:hypothetical protein